MRTNTPITNRERVFSEHQRIVSTTTPGGVLNSVNKHFIDISGFAKEELIGQPHNLVRHPEMPSAAFKDLWSTIKSNRPWMGLVKNRCKNGDFYWVDAFVSPMISDNKTIGYQSVRIKPTAEAVKRATNLYRDINKPPNIVTKAFSWRPSLMGKILLSGLISVAVLLIGAQFFSATSTIGLVSLASLGAITQLFLSSLIAAPWKKAASEAASIFENPIAQKIYTGRDDELGQLQLAMQFLKAQQNTIIWRSSEAVEDLSAAASEANDVAESTQENMNALSQEVDMVATAMTEMTATVQEVAQHAAESAGVIQNANHNVDEGQTVVNESKEIINRLSTRIDEAARVIQGLAEDSERIGSVTDVIDGIAEQTNLLALNAAIEAARAGDLGRGFAVVADEVRSLAGKTQASTGEISAMIISLQGAAKAAVASMQESKSAADESVSHSAKTQSALEVISDNITTVNDMSIQIATAAEEQSAVSEEINRNIVNINENAGSTLNGCRRVKDSNAVVIDNINKLKNMIIQFNNH